MTIGWEPRGRIDHATIGQIVVSPAFAHDRLVVGVSPAGLHVSHDGGEHWRASGLGIVGPFVRDVAFGPNGTMIATSPAGLFVTRDFGMTWDRGGSVESIGPVACDDDEFLIAPKIAGHALLSVAAAPDGSRLFAGVTGNGVLLSDDRGTTWRQVALTGGAVVVDLAPTLDGIRATLVEGITLASDDLHHWREIPPLHEAPTPPLPVSDEIVDVATAGDGSIAAATRSDDGACAVWLRSEESAWRRVIAHPETARTARLAMGSGPRDLFAAIGDSVYRPARLGAALFSREVIDPHHHAEVLALKACVDDRGSSLVAALTASGIFHSCDRGVTWSTLPRPEGPPVTAIGWRLHTGQIELVAAQLGGALQTLSNEGWPT